jgi:hypothetical protein
MNSLPKATCVGKCEAAAPRKVICHIGPCRRQGREQRTAFLYVWVLVDAGCGLEMELLTFCNGTSVVMHYNFSGSLSHAHRADLAHTLLVLNVGIPLRAILYNEVSRVCAVTRQNFATTLLRWPCVMSFG